MHIKLPVGFNIKEGNTQKHVLKLKKILYGEKQCSRIWLVRLCNKLLVLGYTQPKIDECIFYKGNLIFFFYVDDDIFLCPDKHKVNEAIIELN